MLYASCAACRGIQPLYCSGQFFPHVPLEVVPTTAGAVCPNCGLIPQVFTCAYCWTSQYLLLQGGPSPSPFAGSSQSFAAVVQAPAGASESTVMALVKEFVGGAGQAAGNAIFGQ